MHKGRVFHRVRETLDAVAKLQAWYLKWKDVKDEKSGQPLDIGSLGPAVDEQIKKLPHTYIENDARHVRRLGLRAKHNCPECKYDRGEKVESVHSQQNLYANQGSRPQLAQGLTHMGCEAEWNERRRARHNYDRLG